MEPSSKKSKHAHCASASTTSSCIIVDSFGRTAAQATAAAIAVPAAASAAVAGAGGGAEAATAAAAAHAPEPLRPSTRAHTLSAQQQRALQQAHSPLPLHTCLGLLQAHGAPGLLPTLPLPLQSVAACLQCRQLASELTRARDLVADLQAEMQSQRQQHKEEVAAAQRQMIAMQQMQAQLQTQLQTQMQAQVLQVQRVALMDGSVDEVERRCQQQHPLLVHHRKRSNGAVSTDSTPASSSRSLWPVSLPPCRFCPSPGVFSFRHRACDGIEEELGCYCGDHESMLTRMLSSWVSRVWNNLDERAKSTCSSCWSSTQLEQLLPALSDEEIQGQAALARRCTEFRASGRPRQDWALEDQYLASRHKSLMYILQGETAAEMALNSAAASCAGAGAAGAAGASSTALVTSVPSCGPPIASGRFCACDGCPTRQQQSAEGGVNGGGEIIAAPVLPHLGGTDPYPDLHELVLIERSSTAESSARSWNEVERRRHDRLYFFCHDHWIIASRLLRHSHPDHGPILLQPHQQILKGFTIETFRQEPQHAQMTQQLAQAQTVAAK